MADKKMTIREGFENARALYAELGNAEMVEFFDGRIEKLSRKAVGGTRKLTPKQIANASMKEQIAAWMDANTQYTTADVLEHCPAVAGEDVSRSKVAALLSQMGKSGVLNVTEDKKHAKVYTLA
jgi:hypothetical protein